MIFLEDSKNPLREKAEKEINKNSNSLSAFSERSEQISLERCTAAAPASVTDNSDFLYEFSHSCEGAKELQKSAKLWRIYKDMNEYHQSMGKV
jgi:hypothetical protein